MPVFIVSRVDIKDLPRMQAYMAAAPETVEKYGGRYIVRSGKIDVIEGKTRCDRIVVLEFPTKEQALAWYHSPEYTPLRAERWEVADASILLVEA